MVIVQNYSNMFWFFCFANIKEKIFKFFSLSTYHFNPLSPNPTASTNSQTHSNFLVNCWQIVWIVFDHFVWLGLKGFRDSIEGRSSAKMNLFDKHVAWMFWLFWWHWISELKKVIVLPTISYKIFETNCSFHRKSLIAVFRNFFAITSKIFILAGGWALGYHSVKFH